MRADHDPEHSQNFIIKLNIFLHCSKRYIHFFPAAASATTAIASAYYVLGLHGTVAQWCTNSGSRAKSGKEKNGKTKDNMVRQTSFSGKIWTWKEYCEQRRTEVNGEGRSMVQSSLGSRMTAVKSSQVTEGRPG